MSWSVNVTGSPENVGNALRDHSATLSGQSKQEYDEVLPHLLALVQQNVPGPYEIVLNVLASGHASIAGGEKTYGNCSVEIKNLGGRLA